MDTAVILNRVAIMAAENEGRRWTRLIAVAPPGELLGGDVKVSESVVAFSEALIDPENENLILDLVSLAFRKADEFDQRRVQEREARVTERVNTILMNFVKLTKIDREAAVSVYTRLGAMLAATPMKMNGKH